MDGMEKDEDTFITIIVVGNSRVGKSSIIRRQYEKDFNPIYFPTQGVGRTVSYCKSYGNSFKLFIWDVSGSLSSLEATKPLIKLAKGIFFVYDIADQKSFLDIPKWISTVENLCDCDVQKILLGNKVDKGRARTVDKEIAESFASIHQMRFFETSASSRTDTNIKSAFYMMIHDIRKTFDLEFAQRFEIEENEKKSKKSSKRISKCIACIFPCCTKKII